MKCLMIIDMQKALFTEATPRYKAEEVIQKINTLSEGFRSREMPVIFIQHDGTLENYMLPDTEEWEILDELIRRDGDTVISKQANDSFYKSLLEKTLRDRKISEIIFCGCATDFCVNATIQSALTKEFKLTVASDGHTTGDRPGLSSEQVVLYFNWLWENMIPVNGSISVCSSDQILAEL